LPNARLLWGEEVALGGERGQLLYVLDRKEQMTGEGIRRAVVRLSPEGTPEVDLQFSTRAAAQFAKVTGNNVDRRLAIVLDGKVASAPVIQGRISGGRASISGGRMDMKEAGELKVVLEAGALPVPLKIVEERTVGPSLGRDSIRQGIRATLIGGILIIAFMFVYYRGSGLVSVVALALNTLILLAAMGRLSATLTLPGLAGIALTVGMAVDANVLIFERMREEIAAGKTAGVIIERGFSQALGAIVDSNVTTLIAAIVLLQFGAGPIRGFAVTLAIGLIANLFTAVFVSRLIYDILLSRGMKKISV
jgi:preprotein translocase subunit SecD